MAKKITSKEYVYAAGRRRSSVARVRLHKGDKESTVNDIVIGKYFPGDVFRAMWQKPLSLTNTLGKYFITVKVVGGGKHGQLEAVMHGTSKALTLVDETFRGILKPEGLLTRDARERERRMVGTGGRARKQKQSPKR